MNKKDLIRIYYVHSITLKINLYRQKNAPKIHPTAPMYLSVYYTNSITSLYSTLPHTVLHYTVPHTHPTTTLCHTLLQHKAALKTLKTKRTTIHRQI